MLYFFPFGKSFNFSNFQVSITYKFPVIHNSPIGWQTIFKGRSHHRDDTFKCSRLAIKSFQYKECSHWGIDPGKDEVNILTNLRLPELFLFKRMSRKLFYWKLFSQCKCTKNHSSQVYRAHKWNPWLKITSTKK